ncbi:MAG: hypothetical protein ACKVOB_08365 [Sphingomonas sp.]
MAKGPERDALVDSLLRNRRIGLGLNIGDGGGIAHDLNDCLGLGRGREIGIGI